MLNLSSADSNLIVGNSRGKEWAPGKAKVNINELTKQFFGVPFVFGGVFDF